VSLFLLPWNVSGSLTLGSLELVLLGNVLPWDGIDCVRRFIIENICCWKVAGSIRLCHIPVVITTALNKIHVYMPDARIEVAHHLTSVYLLLCSSIFDLER
jgi:hypothetical protein